MFRDYNIIKKGTMVLDKKLFSTLVNGMEFGDKGNMAAIIEVVGMQFVPDEYGNDMIMAEIKLVSGEIILGQIKL